jgi:hypothetical protein
MIYRVLNIVSISAQHRIANAKWQIGAKILATSAIAILPYIIMGKIGYNGSELFLSSALRVVSSLVLPIMYSNFLKELDLISATRNFNIHDFIKRNTLTAWKNLLTTILIVDGFRWIYGMPVYYNDFLRERAGFDLCLLGENRSLIAVIGYNLSAFPIHYLIDELGWSLGKVVIDLGIVAFNRIVIKKDLRDPINSFIEGAMLEGYTMTELQSVRENVAVKNTRIKVRGRNKQNRDIRQEAYVNQSNMFVLDQITQTYTGATATHIIASEQSDKNILVHANTVDPEKIEEVVVDIKDKIKVKRNKIIFDKEEEKELPQRNSRRFEIKFDDHEARLVPLSGATININNLWGVISQSPKEKLHKFQRSLSSGNIGNKNSAIKYLGKDKKNEHIFEIRPCGNDDRIIGKLVRGEDRVYNALTRIFNYERVLNIMKLISPDSPEVSVIIFDEMVRHKELSSFTRM